MSGGGHAQVPPPKPPSGRLRRFAQWIALAATVIGVLGAAEFFYWLSQVGTPDEISAAVAFAEVMVAVAAIIGLWVSVLRPAVDVGDLRNAISMAIRPPEQVSPAPATTSPPPPAPPGPAPAPGQPIAEPIDAKP